MCWLSKLPASLVLLSCLPVFAQQQDQQPPPADEAGPGVARISLMNGDVSVRRTDSTDAFAAALNAPLQAGDTLATGPNARTEIQFDVANRLRLGHDAEARIAELQPGHFRAELARGTAAISVLKNAQGQLEVSTPNVSIRSTGAGLIRVWVRDDGQTVITVRRGEAEIYTERGTERLAQSQTMFVRGSAQDPEYQVVPNTQTDEWDSWNEQRDQSLDNVTSYQYVNPNEYGTEDLDANGSWVNDPSYGEVWSPRVDPGWAPYQQGRWTYEPYYGWTWISADPWGWAPYHYGSWFYGSSGWCWYPGSIGGPAFWRPALVAFFGYGGFGGGVGFGGWSHVGWLPLGPYERFHPWYGRGGSRGVNIANVSIANTYRNARVTGAVSGMAAGAFTAGNFRSISRVSSTELQHAGLMRGGLPARPGSGSYRLSDRQTAVVPRALGANSHFFSRSTYARSQSAQQPGSSSSGWGRFGAPSRSANGFASAPNRPAPSSTSWGRFGAPAPNSTGVGPRYPAYGSGRSVSIAPPIVHNRTYDSAPSGYRPAPPAYRSAQVYRAPSTPSRAATPAPRSAPAASHPSAVGIHPSGGGGGGGGGHHR